MPIPKPVPVRATRARHLGAGFGIVAVMMGLGEWLGRARFGGMADPAGAGGWVTLGVVALLTGGIAALLLDLLVLAPQRRLRAAMAEELAARREWQRRLRHDLRGALSPALLTADRLLTNQDPKVQRAGSLMVQAVERAVALLADRDE